MAIFCKQFDYVMSCQKKKKQMCFGLQPKLTSEVKEKKEFFGMEMLNNIRILYVLVWWTTFVDDKTHIRFL